MPQHITVLNYDPEWPLKYERERKAIAEILDGNGISIYHIGSTSVPGLAAKPIIDMMAVVRSLEKVDDARGKFSELGYEYLGEFGIAGRRYFRKGGDERTHQIHIGTILNGTWHFAIICGRMKKRGQSMPKSKQRLRSGSLMILMDIVTEKMPLSARWKSARF